MDNPKTKNENKNVVILGDSILKAVILGDDSRYHLSKNINWNNIENKLGVSIKNYSKMGNTIGKGKDLLNNILENEKDIHAVIIEYGGNDSDFNWKNVALTPSKNYEPKTSLSNFETDLLNMIEILKEKNIKPILMTLPPINPTKYFNWFSKDINDKNNIMYFLGDIDIIYRRQELYSSSIMKIALNLNLDLIDVRKAFLLSKDFPSLICEDGIHPNDKGQQLIVNSFLDYYLNNIKNK